MLTLNWRKHGLIYSPAQFPPLANGVGFAQSPQALVFDEPGTDTGEVFAIVCAYCQTNGRINRDRNATVPPGCPGHDFAVVTQNVAGENTVLVECAQFSRSKHRLGTDAKHLPQRFIHIHIADAADELC